MTTKFLIALLQIVIAASANAEDFPVSDTDFEKGFGKEGALSASDKTDADRDRLKIGGSLWMQFNYFGLKGIGGRNGYLFMPNSAWTYFDANLRQDVRAYIKIRADYDPTVASGAVSPFTGQTLRQTQVSLEEMKILFNIEKTAFLTIGKQKIKWGSGKFWNPTDFMNSDRRNLLYNEDTRTGVNLVKTHFPIGNANLYVAQKIEGSNDAGLIRHALRVEVPMGPAEISATASILRGEKPLFGIDLSSAIWELDGHAEVSYTEGSRQVYYNGGIPHTDPNRASVNTTLGLGYDWKYSDSDVMTLSAEYFRNGTGLTNTNDYRSLIAAGAYHPYHLSRDYGMVMIFLPTPGPWEKISFTLFNILNLTDESAATKLMTTFNHIQDLAVDLGLTFHYGESDGELQAGGQFIDGDFRLRVQF